MDKKTRIALVRNAKNRLRKLASKPDRNLDEYWAAYEEERDFIEIAEKFNEETPT